MKRVFLINFIFALIFSSCEKDSDGNGEDSKFSILTWDDIEASYSGKFKLPYGGEGVQNQNFYYSSGAFCMLDKNTLIVEGHDYSREARKVVLPTMLNGAEATAEGKWFDPTGGLMSTGMTDDEYYRLGDLLRIDDRIYFTKYVWYNASGTDHDSFGYLQKGASFEDGTTKGMWNADHKLANNMRIGGYLCQAPENLKADGVTFLAGQEGISGAALGRWGPNLFAVKFDDTKPTGEEMNVVPLVVHDSEEKSAGDWWISNHIYSIVWIETETKRGVLVLFTRGYGDTWYGNPDDNTPPDPYGGYKGYHSTGKQLVAWVYDPADLMKVYNGEVEPHLVKPVSEKILIDLKPGDKKGQETYYSNFLERIKPIRMDMYGNRLVFLEKSEDSFPVGYVVDL